ncbi:hypothetical protein [Aquibacillus kalidii]|uniref:hypothetical protein n=1 Tax=Aquibacillus kalidii TaxID=2762597 RepID=UPI001C99BBDB|nr:hypothetical protein [Aquibacillus kalidii]
MFAMVAYENGVTDSCKINNDSQSYNEKLKICTTVYPLQYFAEQIAGEEASGEFISPAGRPTYL